MTTIAIPHKIIGEIQDYALDIARRVVRVAIGLDEPKPGLAHIWCKGLLLKTQLVALIEHYGYTVAEMEKYNKEYVDRILAQQREGVEL